MKKFKELYEEDLYCGDEELDKVLDELQSSDLLVKHNAERLREEWLDLLRLLVLKRKLRGQKRR